MFETSQLDTFAVGVGQASPPSSTNSLGQHVLGVCVCVPVCLSVYPVHLLGILTLFKWHRTTNEDGHILFNKKENDIPLF